jgi:hypothetical protein
MEVFDALRKGVKRAVLVWHRQSGKDDFALHYTATQVMQRPGSYWHLLPLANQCRKVVWDAVNPMTGKKRIDEAFPVELRESTRSQDMVIKFKNGSVWQLVGSDNFNSLVGSTPVGLVFSEFAVADPLAWTYLRPILAANGGWAMFVSTPRGKNHLHGLYEMAKDDPDWFASVVTASDSGVLSQATLDRELREMIAERGPDEGLAKFKQEYYCSFEVTTEGSFYGSIIEQLETNGQITNVPYDPMLPVVTSWDLGMKDPTNVWFFQHYGMQIRVIDCFATTGEGVDAYARMLKDRKYNYEQHIMPHDIRVREIGTNAKTRYEMLQALGVYPITISPKIPVYDGINAVRATLPRMWFDKKKCETGLAALRSYHKEWDDVMKRFRDNPAKDWSNHFSDSLRYYCVGYRQPAKIKTVSEILAEQHYTGVW